MLLLLRAKDEKNQEYIINYFLYCWQSRIFTFSFFFVHRAPVDFGCCVREMHLLKYNKVCAQMEERFTLGRFFAGAAASKSHGKLAAGITADKEGS